MKIFSGLVFACITLTFLSLLHAADFYKWTDEKGEIHFAGSLSEVPLRYRRQASSGTFKEKAFRKNNLGPGEAPVQKGKRSKTYSVPYTAFEGATSRIIVDVVFNGKITAPMVLDTGAGEVIISATLADKLDILESDRPKLDVSVSGFGGTAPAIRTILDAIQIGKLKTEFIPTRVVLPLSENFEGVIGMNFMSRYHVRIDPRKKTVTFEEIDDAQTLYGGYSERWWRSYFEEFGVYLDTTNRYVEALKRYLRENRLAYSSVRDAVKKELRHANSQHQEAEKLLAQLNRYASLNAVPISWRRFRH